MAKVTLEGRNVVVEALKRDRKIFEILIDKGASGEKIALVRELAKKAEVKVSFVSRKDLDRVSSTDNHQGIIGVAEQIKTQNLSTFLKENPEPFILVLREFMYEQNLGAILRSAAAGGVDAVVVPNSQKHPITPLVERVSMGASNEIAVIEASVHNALSTIKKHNLPIVGVELDGTVTYTEANLRGPLAIVLGGEDTGLSLPIEQKCDIVVRVPMMKGIQSLNLSVSAAILIYEKLRQDSLQ